MQLNQFWKMNQKKSKNSSPRIKIIQKIYNSLMNSGVEIEYPKSQFKKFIKDVVVGTLERTELIEETINKHLSKDIDLIKTDKLLKIILFAAVFELIFKHNTPTKVIISEYLLASEYFLEKIQIGYLNAILDKISKQIRK
jgi:transcription antitermination protein NusB